MAKFSGNIGYSVPDKTIPGVCGNRFTIKNCCGDVIKNTIRNQNVGQINDDLVINTIISIIADPFAIDNSHTITYVEYMGVKWKVTNIEVLYPRLLLTLGGVYNGQSPNNTSKT